jgi:ACS family glucarate transporter-like MFS transporter
MLAPIVTGYAVSATGSFTTAFGIAGLLLLVGTTVILTLTRNPIDAPTEPTTIRPVSAGALETGK